MVTYKDTEKKVSTPKRNVKIDGCTIADGYICDEEGNVAQRIANVLPDGVSEFTIKISLVLPDGDDT